MAETKTTQEKVTKAASADAAETTEYWKSILETTRTSYMDSLKLLTKLQGETEKLISSVAKNSKSFQEDNVKIIKEWIETGIKTNEEFKKIFENNYKKVASLFEGLNIPALDFPFKGQFEEMMKKMEENIKKYFSFIKF